MLLHYPSPVTHAPSQPLSARPPLHSRYLHQTLGERFELFQLWTGGMSFHGGFLGVCLAIVLYARSQKIDMLRLKKLQAEQWGVMKELELDRERSLKWQSVYRAVREGAAKLAEAEKFDLIMVDASRIEISTQRAKDAPPLETQAKSQISALRILHAAKTIDVTEKLIVQINNSRGSASASATGSR